MGNSPSSGLGSGSAHGLRDVRTANPEMEVERPRASTEPNENPRDFARELPVPPKPYTQSVVATLSCQSLRPSVRPSVRLSVTMRYHELNTSVGIL